MLIYFYLFSVCSTIGNETVTTCTKDLCLIDENLMKLVNCDHHSSWQSKFYPQFRHKKYREALVYLLGTFRPKYSVKKMKKISYKPEPLPKYFDSFTAWPGIQLTDIKNQGWCGASWAISTSTVASDRFRIATKGMENVEISAQDLISCGRGQCGCKGGHLDRAWNFFRKYG